MSWLAEFAGKAEDFLNKIDKNAATALSTSASSKERETRPKKSEPFIEPEPESQPRRSYSPPPVLEPVAYSANLSTSVTSTQVNESNPPRTGNSSKKSKKQAAAAVTKPVATSDVASVKTVVNGNVDKKLPLKNEKASDEDLISFLNDSSAVNESLILRDEVETQARDLKLLTKNHRALQKDHEELQKKLKVYQDKLAQSETARDCNQQEEQDLRRCLEDKASELRDLQSRHEQALEALRKLEQSQENVQKLDQCALENSQLKSENERLLQRVEQLGNQVEAGENHVTSMKSTLASMEKEFTNYKEKAKSILNYKDELISSLKQDRGGSDSSEGPVGNPPEELVAEITALKNERELLQADISQNRALVTSLKDDNLRLEKELGHLRCYTEDLTGQLKLEKETITRLQSENLEVCQQLTSLQFELERERNERKKCEDSLASLKQTKSSSTTPLLSHDKSSNGHVGQSPEFLEVAKLKTRLTALSQSLYEKQGLINDLSTDKQLLQIEVERLRNQVREGPNDGEFCTSGLPQTVIASQPLYLSESPWDSRVSAKMKRMYTQLDAVFCQFGLALRKRPNLRLGMSLYVVFLHLWVFFVLTSWMHHTTPE